MRLHSRTDGARAGFTLAEVAVTLLIVSIALVLVQQGLNTCTVSSAETHARKVARDLALITLGQIESGLYWEELDNGNGDSLSGNYAEEDYPDYQYEVVLGDEEFHQDYDSRREAGYHDSWAAERDREDRAEERDKTPGEDEEPVAEPFQKVRIKVIYPQFGERKPEIVLKRWMTWEQVYGAPEGAEGAAKGKSGQDAGAN